MPAKQTGYEADGSFTWSDGDVHVPYSDGDDWLGTDEQATALLIPVDNDNGKRPALLRVKTRSPRKEN